MSSVKSIEKVCPNTPEFSQEFKVFEACVAMDDVEKVPVKKLTEFWAWAKDSGGATYDDDGRFIHINTIPCDNKSDGSPLDTDENLINRWRAGQELVSVVCQHVIKKKIDRSPSSLKEGFYPVGFVVGYGKGVIYVWHTSVHSFGVKPPSSYLKAARRGTGVVKKWLLAESRFILEEDAEEWFGDGVDECGQSVVARLPILGAWSGNKATYHKKQAAEYEAVVETVVKKKKIKVVSKVKLFKKYIGMAAECATTDEDKLGDYLEKANNYYGDLSKSQQLEMAEEYGELERLVEVYNETDEEEEGEQGEE
tara:strand:- start:58 stop:984 length:927 start_codon:yes stop_codon:yes gene_type:complete